MALTPEEIAASIAKQGETLGTRIASNEERLKALEAARTSNIPAEKENPSILKIARGLLTGRFDGVEKEIFAKQDEIKRTLMQTGSNAVGGYVIPPEYSNKLIDKLDASSVLTLAGAQRIVATGSPYTIPRLATGCTYAYAAQTAAIGNTNPTFEQVSATPHQASGYVEITRLAAELSDPGLEQIVSNRLLKDASLFMDKTGLLGAGGTEPLGLINDSDIESTALNAALTIAACEASLARLETNNGIVDENSVAWIMTPWAWQRLRAEVASSSGVFLLQGDKQSKTRRSLLGYPVFLTTQIPQNAASGVANESQVILGDFSQLYHLIWGNVAVEASAVAGSAFVNHSVYVKCAFWDDWKVANPGSFDILTDVR